MSYTNPHMYRDLQTACANVSEDVTVQCPRDQDRDRILIYLRTGNAFARIDALRLKDDRYSVFLDLSSVTSDVDLHAVAHDLEKLCTALCVISTGLPQPDKE